MWIYKSTKHYIRNHQWINVLSGHFLFDLKCGNLLFCFYFNFIKGIHRFKHAQMTIIPLGFFEAVAGVVQETQLSYK